MKLQIWDSNVKMLLCAPSSNWLPCRYSHWPPGICGYSEVIKIKFFKNSILSLISPILSAVAAGGWWLPHWTAQIQFIFYHSWIEMPHIWHQPLRQANSSPLAFHMHCGTLCAWFCKQVFYIYLSAAGTNKFLSNCS